MRIQSITPFRLNNFVKQNNQNQKTNYIQNNTYNPIAYNDLTFTARLCRTPEEFYSEPCNKNYMPETMKQYLNADFDDRKNMPPEQMLALVFEDINETKSLEQVRRIFPDEPLFKNLKDAPNKKSRVGVLAEIDLMREEGKTLFKNGKDNLGHYILKKIYLEGKTLEEINADLKKDISVHYAGLSPITYQDTSAFGIKFPDRHFWSSFVPHRRRFEPIKPRKPIERRNSSPKTTTDSTQKSAPKQRNRFSDVKDWEIDSFSEALIKGNGSKSETIKRLKKSSVRDDASLGFVAKYMGEINSVVLEKLHISPEMSDFFENYDGLSKSQKQRLDDYWKNTDTRELRSTIMKDVIKLFFEAYGVDGQNDEFKELIDYAHSIKPARIEQQKEHNRIQAEYDEMAERLLAEEKAFQIEQIDEAGLDELGEMLRKIEDDLHCKKYKGENNETLFTEKNIKETFEDTLASSVSFYPKSFRNKYTRFLLSDARLTKPYMLSYIVKEKGYVIPDSSEFMTEDELYDVTKKIDSDFFKSNKLECRAVQQALTETLIPELKPDELAAFFVANPLVFLEYDSSSNACIDHFALKADFINSTALEYKRPLSGSEANRITNIILSYWRNFEQNNSILIDKQLESPLIHQTICNASKYLKRDDKPFVKMIKSELFDYVNKYGGPLRFMLNKDIPEDVIRARFEAFLVDYYKDCPQNFYRYKLISDIML